MTVSRLALLGSLLCLPSLALAAEIGSVTLTLAETEADFSGGPVIGTNAGDDAEQLRCLDPVAPCDTVAVTVDVPEDIAEYFPTGILRATVAPTDSPTGADDYDLFLYDASGNTIAASTSPAGTEAVVGILRGGSNDYTVEVEHWLVVGGSYAVNISLDLGSPSEDKTDEEVAAWLEENTGIAEARSVAARNAEACTMPGLVLLSDAGGDVNPLQLLPVSALPVDSLDLLELSIFQQGSDEAGDALIGFRMQLAGLSGELTPNSAYYSSFMIGATQVIFGVRMAVSQEGEISFFSYIAGPNNSGGIDGRFVADGSERPADPASYYDESGEIVIFVRPIDIGLFAPGEKLSGFNAASTVGVGVSGAGGVAGTSDEMPDGLGRSGVFTYLSDAECAPESGEGEGETGSAGSRADSRSLSPGRGGALLWLPLMLLLLGLRRR